MDKENLNLSSANKNVIINDFPYKRKKLYFSDYANLFPCVSNLGNAIMKNSKDFLLSNVFDNCDACILEASLDEFLLFLNNIINTDSTKELIFDEKNKDSCLFLVKDKELKEIINNFFYLKRSQSELDKDIIKQKLIEKMTKINENKRFNKNNVPNFYSTYFKFLSFLQIKMILESNFCNLISLQSKEGCMKDSITSFITSDAVLYNYVFQDIKTYGILKEKGNCLETIGEIKNKKIDSKIFEEYLYFLLELSYYDKSYGELSELYRNTIFAYSNMNYAEVRQNNRLSDLFEVIKTLFAVSFGADDEDSQYFYIYNFLRSIGFSIFNNYEKLVSSYNQLCDFYFKLTEEEYDKIDEPIIDDLCILLQDITNIGLLDTMSKEEKYLKRNINLFGLETNSKKRAKLNETKKGLFDKLINIWGKDNLFWEKSLSVLNLSYVLEVSNYDNKNLFEKVGRNPYENEIDKCQYVYYNCFNENQAIGCLYAKFLDKVSQFYSDETINKNLKILYYVKDNVIQEIERFVK